MSRHLFPNRGYDDDTAFVGIGRVAVSPIFLCVNPRIGVSSIAELIAKAKEAPGRMSYASSGAGSSRISRPSCSCAAPTSGSRT